MNYFFFYNKMTTNEMISRINTDYTLEDAYVYVDMYDKINQRFSFKENNYNSNKIKINGKLCCFNLSLIEILKKLNNIDEIKTTNYTYTVEQIKIKKTSDNTEIKPYIIY
jgi:hypothetical protein